ncbi:MAG: carbohydrate kinase [Selenomonas sp.]|nr:carbohydrate kinase [Selenomonas sp.]
MKEELLSLLDELEGQRILVLGDVVADIYLQGSISRISREAPVLVLEQQKEVIVAGGAANVVNNVATLGGSVFAVGLLGHDSGGEGLKEVLQRNGAHIEGLLTDENRPTISKTRIIAGGRATVSQQIVRVDKECHEPLTEAHERELLKYIKSVLPQMQGVVLSDYGSGTVTPKLRKAIIRYAREHGIPTMVDSRYDVKSFKGIGYVKQNDAELAAAVGRSLPDEEAVIEAAQELLRVLEAEGVLVTRGELGMILVEADGAVHVIPVSDKSEVYDVSGAGDTCVAAVILALAAGVSPEKAAELSNVASGIAVRKLGTATVSAEELRRALAK